MRKTTQKSEETRKQEEEKDSLLKTIGEQKVEIDFLKKKYKQILKCTPKVGQKKFNFRRCIFNVQIHRGIEKANST